jgi:hypothetical protein
MAKRQRAHCGAKIAKSGGFVKVEQRERARGIVDGAQFGVKCGAVAAKSGGAARGEYWAFLALWRDSQ